MCWLTSNYCRCLLLFCALFHLLVCFYTFLWSGLACHSYTMFCHIPGIILTDVPFYNICNVMFSSLWYFSVLTCAPLVLLYALFFLSHQNLYCSLYCLEWLSWTFVFLHIFSQQYSFCWELTSISYAVSSLFISTTIASSFTLSMNWFCSLLSLSLYLHFVGFTHRQSVHSYSVLSHCISTLQYFSNNIVSLWCGLNFSHIVSKSFFNFLAYPLLSCHYVCVHWRPSAHSLFFIISTFLHNWSLSISLKC